MSQFLALLLALNAAPEIAVGACDHHQFALVQQPRREKLTGEMQLLLDELKELGRKRAVVAEQITKVTVMNPIERGLKSTVDARYDLKSLNTLSRSLANQMSVTAQRSTVLKLEADLLQLEQQAFTMRCGG